MILREIDGGVEISIRAQPRASRTEVAGPYGERAVRVRLAAPPVDGAANEELVAFLAGLFDVPTRAVEILRGHGSRSKTVRVLGVGPARARKALGL
ncbi:MAG: YggU family protein [Gemmatimonadetes bacterium]|nr:YggU family protein [Gemmatimonadota bacterium]NIR79197.1 YggU family protein [Gemmatimonadota bacterium]NIT87857.1 YggU family protein [Gemmatimonadota bacterium]NIU31713.1 YggU family protein [Gemmatimonadota bacterium]NIU36333.1 YggU family protein [Gemmatimonadota bacterium]